MQGNRGSKRSGKQHILRADCSFVLDDDDDRYKETKVREKKPLSINSQLFLLARKKPSRKSYEEVKARPKLSQTKARVLCICKPSSQTNKQIES